MEQEVRNSTFPIAYWTSSLIYKFIDGDLQVVHTSVCFCFALI